MAAKPSYEELEKEVARLKRAGEDLLESEKKLNIIANTALDSIFIKDVDRRYSFVNPAMAQLFRCQEGDLLGKRPEDVFGQEEADTVNEVDSRTLKGENVSEIRDLYINWKFLFISHDPDTYTRLSWQYHRDQRYCARHHEAQANGERPAGKRGAISNFF